MKSQTATLVAASLAVVLILLMVVAIVFMAVALGSPEHDPGPTTATLRVEVYRGGEWEYIGTITLMPDDPSEVDVRDGSPVRLTLEAP